MVAARPLNSPPPKATRPHARRISHPSAGAVGRDDDRDAMEPSRRLGLWVTDGLKAEDRRLKTVQSCYPAFDAGSARSYGRARRARDDWAERGRNHLVFLHARPDAGVNARGGRCQNRRPRGAYGETRCRVPDLRNAGRSRVCLVHDHFRPDRRAAWTCGRAGFGLAGRRDGAAFPAGRGAPAPAGNGGRRPRELRRRSNVDGAGRAGKQR